MMHVTTLLVVCLGACPSARAESTTPTFSLNWVRREGAEQCASSQLLARAIEQLLGPVLRAPGEAELAIEGSIAQPKPGAFEMEMRVLTPDGEVMGTRSLRREARDCSALTPAILLVLTLTLDPDGAAYGFPTELLARISNSDDPSRALLAELDREAQSSAKILPPPAPARAPPAVPAVHAPAGPKARSTPRLWQGALQVGPALAFALLPTVAWGPSVAAELTTPWSVSLLFGLNYWAPSSAEIDSYGQGKTVRFSAAQAQLSLCIPTLPKSAWELSACAGGAAGVRWADASALSRDEQARGAYGGPLVQLVLRYAITVHWFAALELAGALLWPRDQFTYQDVGDEAQLVFEPQLASAWTSLSLGVRL